MGKRLRFLGFLATLFVFAFSSNSFAADNYVCDASTKTYESCSSGYYMDSGTCKACPAAYPNSLGGTGGIKSCYANVTLNKNGRDVTINGGAGTGCVVQSSAYGTNSATLIVYYDTACTLPSIAAGSYGGYYYSGWSTSNALDPSSVITSLSASTSAPVSTLYLAKTGCDEYYYRPDNASGTCSHCGSGSKNTADNLNTYCTCLKGYSVNGTPSGSSTYSTTATGGAACSLIEYEITLHKHGGTGGTSTIYARYDDGLWLESGRDSNSDSHPLTTSCTNRITLPIRTGYTFNGYYSQEIGGDRLVDNTGCVTNAGTMWLSETNATWHAQWTANTCTITFKTGSDTMGSMLSFTTGQSSLTPLANLDNNDPVDSDVGWEFAGWAITPEINSYTYQMTQSLFSDESDSNSICTTNGGSVTLYGVWDRSVKFKYYDTASATSPSEINIAQYYGNSDTSTAAVTSVTAPGLHTSTNYEWAPLGWASNDTSSSASIDVVQTGGTGADVMPAVSTYANYYAMYSRTPQIAYGKNGGSGTNMSNSDCNAEKINAGATYAASTSCALSENTYTAPSSDLMWVGWSTNTSGTPSYTTTYTRSNKTWTDGKVTPMLAIWGDATRTITFKSDNTTLYTQTCTHGETVDLDYISYMNVPSELGYYWDFDGWTTYDSGLDAQVAQYANHASLTCDNMTLYGVWSRDITFKYMHQDPSNSWQTSTRTQYYRQTSSSTAAATPVSTYPLYQYNNYGWEPMGWITSESITSSTTADVVQTNATTKSITPAANSGATTYYALYQREPSIAYNANGGSGTMNNSVCGVQKYSAKTANASSSCKLSANGFTKPAHATGFSKWAEGSTSGTQYSAGSSGDNYTPPAYWASEDPIVTMYAKWTCESGYSGEDCSTPNTITITLNKNGGSGKLYNGEGTLSDGDTNGTTTCTAGGTMSLPTWSATIGKNPTNMTNISKTKRVFKGWNTSSNASTPNAAVTCPTSDTTFYAVWVEPTCTAGTGVASASLSDVDDNKPVCSVTCNDNYYGSSFTGSAGETSVTTTCNSCSGKTSQNYPYSAAGAEEIDECYKKATLNKNGFSGILTANTGNGCSVVSTVTGTNNGEIKLYYDHDCVLPTIGGSENEFTQTGYVDATGWSLSSAVGAEEISIIIEANARNVDTIYVRKASVSCDDGYYLDNGECISCTTVTCGTRTDTETCNDCTCTVTNGTCDCNPGTREYTENCTRTGGAGGQMGSDSCTGTSWARDTSLNGICTGTDQITCNQNYVLNSGACSSCSSLTNGNYTETSAAGATSVTSCYADCTTNDVPGSTTVQGVKYSNATGTGDGVKNCIALACDSEHCLASDGSCVAKPENGSCTGNPSNPIQCDPGYTLTNGVCVANQYTVTYSCGSGATGTQQATEEERNPTYNARFTPAAPTCTKTDHVFGGWIVSGTSPQEIKDAGVEFTWTYLQNKTFTAKWVGTNDCDDGEYFDSTSLTCVSCSTATDDEFPLSESGATSINECYNTCETAGCTDPEKPDNATSGGWWYDQWNTNEGKQYYGTNTCTYETTGCDYTNIVCKTNYYLNLDIWTCTTNEQGRRVCTAPASSKNNACIACSSLPGGFNKCSSNSLTVFGGGPELCHISDVAIPCTQLLPYPTHATNCTYIDYQGTELVDGYITGSAYYPDGELQAYTYNTYQTDEYGNNIYKPKGCYMSTCTCEPGYKFESAVAGDPTDPGACVPDVFEVTLNSNCGGGSCDSNGTTTVFEKYSVGWYNTLANANAGTSAVTSITKPTWANHSFAGYYDDPTNGSIVISASGVLPASTTLTADTVLYAHWDNDMFPCQAGKTATGATCPEDSYCPGEQVDYALRNDTTSGCARTCPLDVANGTISSASGSTLITQCKATRANTPVQDNTGSGDQTCYYDDTAKNYSRSCTIIIRSCNAGRWAADGEASTTCDEVGKGAYSPAGDITKHMCSDLSGADATVTTDGTASGPATACYNVCSTITIEHGSKIPTSEKSNYDGTTIPACEYTTSCSEGYETVLNGEACAAKTCEVTLNHNNTGCTTNCTTPTSPIFLKYATGWYASRADADAGTGAITSVTPPTWPGQTFFGYLTESQQRAVNPDGTLAADKTLCGDETTLTVTASWEQNDTVSCEPGTYYTGNGDTCTDCPAGSYCGGGIEPIQDTGVVSGITACPTDASTYTAAMDANGDPLTVAITSAAKSKFKSDCYATNVAYSASQGTGSRTCHYNESANKYIGSDLQPCTDIQMLTCTTGHWLDASQTTTDCSEVGVGYYSPDIVMTKKECPNRNEDPTITTSDGTAGSIQRCYRGNIWYQPQNGHSGHRRNCFHTPNESDTNIDTGYTYNCDVSVVVTCDAGYYYDGSYVNSSNEKDCKPVGDGNYSPAQSACPGEELQPSMDNPGCSTQLNMCPVGTGVADVTSTTPNTGSDTAGTAITDCYLTCEPTKNLNGTIVNVVSSHVSYNTTKDAYNKCTYDSNVCPEDMWCDSEGFHDCPNDNDGTPGKAELVPNQKYRGIETCYVEYNPFQPTGGYPNHVWGNGTGWVRAYYVGTETNGDYTNYNNVGALTCDAGYYYDASIACSGVGSCYYSPAQSNFPNETPTKSTPGSSTQQIECPAGCSGSELYASSYVQCYKACDATTANFEHSKTVVPVSATVTGASATTYNACNYTITCDTGYDILNNGTATPSCDGHTYTITLDKNGGAGSTQANVQCKFDSGTCALPAISDERAGYSTAGQWCTGPDGTGDCYDAGTNIATNISSDGSDMTLYAKWTPNVYTITLNHNGAATTGTPGTVYLKYATGWYSNANATTSITQMTRKPVKGVMEFTGYKGNDVTVIGADGKFITSESALTFTTANATITAQWADAPITCPAGKYYTGTGDDPNDPNVCKTCTENHYCPETTVNTNSGEAGLIPCTDSGMSPAGSVSSAACYKEDLPTYVADHGKGTQTCYYDETTMAYSDRCKDFVITTCDAGYWLDTTKTSVDCSEAEVGHYSGNLELVQHECPNGGTTNGTTKTTIQDCYKTNLDYTATDGSGTGTQSCWYSSGEGASAVYSRDCFDKVITACRGGYYRENAGDIVCTEADYNHYSEEGDLEQHACPGQGQTRNKATAYKDLCYEDGLDYVAEHGGGSQTCYWNATDNQYNIGCGDKSITYCNGGYYLVSPQDLDCGEVGYNAWSPDRDLDRHDCPVGTTTLTTTSAYESDCFTCPEDHICNPTVGDKTCSELTNGQFTRSDAGKDDPKYCYRDCDLVENASLMTGRDYNDNGDEPDTCEVVTCAAGYSLSNGQCVKCPAGSFCDGTTGGDGDADGDGAKSCADLGDGSWMYSAPGATSANDCYRKCEEQVTDNCTLTPVENKAYWPNNCQFTGTSATGNPAEVVDGVCHETSCINTYEMINGVCQPCDRENAISYKAEGNCVVESCVIGYHPNNSACEADIVDCTDNAPNATYAEQKWDSVRGVYSICTIKTCEDDFHLASNTCVPNEQVCDIANGVGTRTWNTTTNTWNACVATSCVPGYTNDPAEKNNASEQCSECRNKFSTLGEVAASSYSTGCEIASCMYQGEKYNLDGNECVPICEDGYSDETGRLHWNDRTKKCDRICNTDQGYMPW